LLPIDSSRRAECALPAAITLAEATGAQLLLASVVRPPELPLPRPYPPEINQLVEKFVTISRDSAGAYLEELQNRLPAPAESRLVEQDSVAHAIHNLAEQENADLVIFCAHGLTGRIDLPYGSVSRNYIEHGTRNALVIQDVHRSQVRPTEAEIAAEKYGRR
jgi:nucleotide-binding universal stress UspA family protein